MKLMNIVLVYNDGINSSIWQIQVLIFMGKISPTVCGQIDIFEAISLSMILYIIPVIQCGTVFPIEVKFNAHAQGFPSRCSGYAIGNNFIIPFGGPKDLTILS